MKDSQNKLLKWYKKNYRKLPWRETADPYPIWISEIMLQQTRVAAVLDYYKRFLTSFPNVHELAKAKESKLMENWAGLGYYSRARNIHKSAKLFSKNGFPQSYQELINYPGLGPYTARAIASFAFKQKTGVLDGNVIRLISRKHNKKAIWWKTTGRNELQVIVDQYANHKEPDLINQALIELGATICLVQNPACNICPWENECQGRKNNNLDILPLKKDKKKNEIWNWELIVLKNKDEFGFIKNPLIPFLKSQYNFLGAAKKSKTPLSESDISHSITHHKIYIKISELKYSDLKKSVKLQKKLGIIDLNDIAWTTKDKVYQISPSSITKKVFKEL